MRLRKERVRPVGRLFAGRRLGVALATAGLLAGSLTSAVVVAAPANAAPFIWSFQNSAHLDCLSSSGILNGETRVFSCNGSSNQHWYYGGLHGAYAQVINQATRQCLSISGRSTANGVRAVEVNCSGNDANYWEPTQGPIGPSFNVYFLNQHSQKLIQIDCNCNNNGAHVIQEPVPAFPGGNQLWYPQSF